MEQSTLQQAELAARFVNLTDRHVFLTGKAGTGKTTFLKYIIENTHKRAVVVAPTGIAAINAGGVTIHSLFQLPFGNFIPHPLGAKTPLNFKVNDAQSLIKNIQMRDNKRKLIRELELLIIDEVSMLRADLLDAIDIVMRHIRRQGNRPFGGVQVLFIGDMLQLPPVVKDDEWSLLRNYYSSMFFFDALVLRNNKPLYIELEKIYRQDDKVFINLLNNLRNNTITVEDGDLLNKFYKPDFRPKADENYITLTTHNYKASQINTNMLQKLGGKSFTFEAEVKDDYSEYLYPVEKELILKKGAQVMFIKNDPTGEHQFFNGKLGVIHELSSEEIIVKIEDSTNLIKVEKYIWQNNRYIINEQTNEIEEQVIGTFTHYPLKLAWAITVHKSQGLTFEKAIIDVREAFAPGQVYVALSRLRSLNGLVLTSMLNFKGLYIDGTIRDYAKNKELQGNLNKIVNDEVLSYSQNYISGCFDFDFLQKTMKYHSDSFKTEDDKNSVKNKYKSWANELVIKVSELQPVSEKFRKQLSGIFYTNTSEKNMLVKNRVEAAKDFFMPQLKEISNYIFNHIGVVSTNHKRVKTYINELFDLELMIYEHIRKLFKAVVFADALLYNKTICKEDIDNIPKDIVRLQRINELLSNRGILVDVDIVKTKKNKKDKTSKNTDKVKVKTEKEEKPKSREESFQLFKNGNNIEDISRLRGMAESTIEGHLSFYVANGELEVLQFLSEEKLSNIKKVIKKLETDSMGAIKAALGDEYTYADIRFTYADMRKFKDEN